MIEISKAFDEGLELVRSGIELRSPLQRLCCDLRSLDRHRAIYDAFAAEVGWGDRAVSLRRIVEAIWRTGDPRAVSRDTIQAVIPDPERVGGSYAATAQMIGLQLLKSVNAAMSGRFHDAISAVEQSFETVYAYEQEKDLASSESGIVIVGGGTGAGEMHHRAEAVRREAVARRDDLDDPSVAALVKKENLAKLRRE